MGTLLADKKKLRREYSFGRLSRNDLDKVKMNHPWIKSHADDFTAEKWHRLLDSVNKYYVTHHNWISKKKQDSYILKVAK